jgi:nucleoside-diphosphate kinase
LENTLIILKPDALQRRLAGRILGRFEEKGLQIVGLKLAHLKRELVEEHYAPHRGKPFYAGLVRYMTSHPVVLMVLRGRRAVDVCRKLLGKTFGYDAEPGTIRGDFGISKSMNLVHASDSLESATREISLFFQSYEIFDAKPADLCWIYDPVEELGESARS